MIWDLYVKVCGEIWLWVWFLYWFGLMTFHASRERPEIYVPGFIKGAKWLMIGNTVWFVIRAVYLFI